MKKIRVALVEDHQMVREGLRRLLELEEGIEVVGETGTGEEALARLPSLFPDVVLMDLRLPGMDGVEATRQLKKELPDLKVIMLTFLEDDRVTEAIEAGASGYLLKKGNRQQLLQAIQSAYCGQYPIDPSLSRGLLAQLTQLMRRSRESYLSERQSEILRLVASGVPARGIARQLFVSESTVKRELRHIFEKLGVRNQAHAVAEALRRKLI